MDERNPCETCEKIDGCLMWDEKFCCALCKYYGELD